VIFVCIEEQLNNCAQISYTQIIKSTPHKNIITCKWGNDVSSAQELSIHAVILPPSYWYSTKVAYNGLTNRTTPQLDKMGVLSFAIQYSNQSPSI